MTLTHCHSALIIDFFLLFCLMWSSLRLEEFCGGIISPQWKLRSPWFRLSSSACLCQQFVRQHLFPWTASYIEALKGCEERQDGPIKLFVNSNSLSRLPCVCMFLTYVHACLHMTAKCTGNRDVGWVSFNFLHSLSLYLVGDLDNMLHINSQKHRPHESAERNEKISPTVCLLDFNVSVWARIKEAQSAASSSVCSLKFSAYYSDWCAITTEKETGSTVCFSLWVTLNCLGCCWSGTKGHRSLKQKGEHS